MKQNIVPFALISLLVVISINSMHRYEYNLNHEKNIHRWAQLIHIQAQMESNPLYQQNLFDKAINLAYESKKTLHDGPKNKKGAQELKSVKTLLKKIKKSRKFAHNNYYASDAKKALVIKTVAQHFVHEAKATNGKLEQKRRLLSKNLTNKQRKKLQHTYTRLVDEKNTLLDNAQKQYLAAAALYLKVYDHAQKKRYLTYAETIILEKIYDLELEKSSTSHIFIIYDEKTRLLQEIQKRKGIVQ